MARTRTIASIDTELSKLQEELMKLQQKEEAIKSRQLQLQKQKREQETKQIMDAYMKSGRSMEELLIFLDV